MDPLSALATAAPSEARACATCDEPAHTSGLCRRCYKRQWYQRSKGRPSLLDAPPATHKPPAIPSPRRAPDDAPSAPPELPADQLAPLRLIVEDSGGSLLASPAELAQEARRVAEVVGAPGILPITGTGLAGWLARHAEALATAGLLVRYTERGTPDDVWTTDWLAVTDATADLAGRDAHEPLDLAAVALVDRIEAVLQSLLAGRDSWDGPLSAVQKGWRQLPSELREELSGRPWPSAVPVIGQAFTAARAHLAARGLAVELTANHVAVVVKLAA